MRHGRGEAPRVQRRDELERRTADAEPEALRPVERLLALQRSAGNQAVSALLARSPDTAAPTDDQGAKVSGPRATLTGIGTIALLSVSLDPSRAKGTTPGRGGSDNAPKDIVITSRLGPHSPKLSKAALDGKAMDVEIVMPGGKSAVVAFPRERVGEGGSVKGAEKSGVATGSRRRP
jgi:hypothetical protein